MSKNKPLSSVATIYGVGINDSDTPVVKSHKVNGKWVSFWRCPFYRVWVRMMERGLFSTIQREKSDL